MFRTTDIVLVAVMVSAAAFTYKTKHEADNLKAEIARLERQIAFEKDSIDLLKADWSLLTQPARLQRLVEVYGNELELKPLEAQQIADFGELPSRRIDIDAVTGKSLGGMAEGAVDTSTITGGVVQ